jgi:GTP:adenosylcobinamide-phosphate guanylyltransferase
MVVNVVVTAGGIPAADEPLYPLTRGGPKAMLSLAGRPMLQWVLDALDTADSIQRIVLVGLPSQPDGALHSRKPLSYVPGQGDMLANIQAGAREVARLDPSAEHILVCSSDIPAISAEMVEWLAAQVRQENADICYNVITRETMETGFPGSRRTYVKLKDMQVCGGDVNAVRQSVALGAHPIWKRIIAARKNPLRQAALVGFDTLLLLILRQLGVRDLEKRVNRRMGLHARALVCPYAEMGMDVDKPFQLEMLRQELERKGSAQAH